MRRTKIHTPLIGLMLAAVGCATGSNNGTDTNDVGGDSSTGASDVGAGRSGGESAVGGDGSGAGHVGAGAGDTGGAGTGGGGTGPSSIVCTHVGSGTDYQVGPGKAYENIGDVPFESLVAGDTVRIFWRADAYHEKLMISGVGTAEQPIRVCGVSGPAGQLPVIDGANATTRAALQFPYDGHQLRGLVIIGHKHDDPYALQPAHIVLEGLEIKNASPENTFVDKSGQTQSYTAVAAGVFVQRADDVTVRGCDVHDNNNGLFIGTSGDVELTQRVLIEGNHVYQNGSLTDFYHHNVYNEASDVTYQFNRFGEPRAGAGGEVLGANIKERSAGVTIRYNFIEDGAHMIDLVDAQEAAPTTLPMASFHESHVYGNIFVRNGTSKGSMIHYGGDSGIYDHYRKGTLYFYENTVVVNNQSAGDYDRPAVFELSTNDEMLVATNNIFYSALLPTPLRPVVLLGARDGVISGHAQLSHNWVTTGWSPFDQLPGSGATVVAQVDGLSASLFGADPGFVSAATADFSLVSGAAVIGAGVPLDAVMPAAPPVAFEYVDPASGVERAPESPPTLGAIGP